MSCLGLATSHPRNLSAVVHASGASSLRVDRAPGRGAIRGAIAPWQALSQGKKAATQRTRSPLGVASLRLRAGSFWCGPQLAGGAAASIVASRAVAPRAGILADTPGVVRRRIHRTSARLSFSGSLQRGIGAVLASPPLLGQWRGGAARSRSRRAGNSRVSTKRMSPE